jgi:hypothetical protein
LSLNSFFVEGSIRSISAFIGCAGGVGGGVYTGLKFAAQTNNDVDAGAFVGTAVSILAGCGGFGIAALIGALHKCPANVPNSFKPAWLSQFWHEESLFLAFFTPKIVTVFHNN